MFVRPDLRGAYLPRIEIFNDTTLRRFVDVDPVGGRGPPTLPEAGTSALAKGKREHLLARQPGRRSKSPANILLENTWAPPALEAGDAFRGRSDLDRGSVRRAVLAVPVLQPSTRPSDLLWAYYADRGTFAYRDKLLADPRELRRLRLARGRRRPQRASTMRHASAFRAMVLVNCYWKLDRSGDLRPHLAGRSCRICDRPARRVSSPIRITSTKNTTTDSTRQQHCSRRRDVPRLRSRERRGVTRLAPASRSSSRATLSMPTASRSRTRRSTTSTSSRSPPRSPNGQTGTASVFRPSSDRVSGRCFATRPSSSSRTEPCLSSGPASGSTSARCAPISTAGSARSIPSSSSSVEAAFPASSRRPAWRCSLQSGTAILRSGFGSPETFADETHVVFDVGPWRTAHSHLDALAVTYYSAGRALLPDSGLFRYEEGGAEHRYFWSTRAHNTVVVDGRSQHTGAAHAGLTRKGTAGWLYQSGSHRLYRGVEHDRSVLLLRRDLALVVDRLTGGESHRYVQTWHVFPGARVTTTGLSLLASGGDGRPALAIHQAQGLQPIELRTISGGEQPLQGWYSDEYGKRVANTVAEYGVLDETRRSRPSWPRALAAARHLRPGDSVRDRGARPRRHATMDDRDRASGALRRVGIGQPGNTLKSSISSSALSPRIPTRPG